MAIPLSHAAAWAGSGAGVAFGVGFFAAGFFADFAGAFAFGSGLAFPAGGNFASSPRIMRFAPVSAAPFANAQPSFPFLSPDFRKAPPN
jgi:hypothetical protein